MDSLGREDGPVHLDAAGGGAGAAADERADDQERHAERRPQRGVLRREPGRGRDGRHLESGVPERVPEVPVMAAAHQIGRHQDNGDGEQGQEHLDGLRLPHEPRPAPQEGQEQDAEVDAGGDHGHRQDDFGGWIRVESDARVPGAETAGTARGHRVGERVEPAHAGESQGEEGDSRQ